MLCKYLHSLTLHTFITFFWNLVLQDEIHDSIEDAKTSLLLYRKYKAIAAEGPERLNAVLQDLYAFGNRNNWTIGMDKLNNNNTA